MGDKELVRLLRLRGQLGWRPPASIEDLAARLAQPQAALDALDLLDRGAVQVVALLAQRGPSTAADLAGALSRTEPVEPAYALQALRRASPTGLVWSDDRDVWRAVSGLRHSAGALLVAGPPAGVVLERLPITDLRRVCAALGLPAVRSRGEGMQLAAGLLGVPARLKALLDGAPDGLVELLGRRVGTDVGLAAQGGELERWAGDRLMLVEDALGGLTPVREVSALLLGGRPVARLAREPVATPPTDAGSDCAQRSTALVEQVRALLDLVRRTPLVALKSGGIGVREVRRLGKALGCPPQRAAWLLDLAGVTGLLSTGWGAGQLTDTAGHWSDLDDAEAYLPLVRSALSTPGGPRPLAEPPLVPEELPAPLSGMRSFVGSLVDLADVGRAALQAGPELAAWCDWRFYRSVPRLRRDLLWAERVRQLELLGLRTEQGVAGWLAALLDGDHEAALAALTVALPPGQASALWQADSTAFVAGRPSAGLRALLDAVADRESERTWRLSALRVRDALDAGRSGEDLLADLRTAAARGLPQTVEQAVRDVARRHGQVRVVPASTLLQVADEPLVQTLLRDRRLAPLDLTELQSGLLVSPREPQDVLASLRAAGHAPVGPAAPRPPVQQGRPLAPPRVADDGVPALVDRLRRGRPAAPPATRLPAQPALGPDDPLDLQHLPPADAELLLHVLEQGGAVEIDYLRWDGQPSTQVLEDPAEDSGMLLAWAWPQEQEEVFDAARVLAVRPG